MRYTTAMLTAPTDLMPPLLAACPSFAPEWNAFVEEWREADELPIYLALGDLVRHLAELLGTGDLDTVRRTLDTVEALLEAATVTPQNPVFGPSPASAARHCGA